MRATHHVKRGWLEFCGDGVLARTHEHQADRDREESQVDFDGRIGKFLCKDDRHRHDHRNQGAEHTRPNAQQDRDPTNKFRQRGEIAEHHGERELHHRQHADEFFHPRVFSKEFAVAVIDEYNTERDAKNQERPALAVVFIAALARILFAHGAHHTFELATKAVTSAIP